LPPYSPNLNLIERWWKFVKKRCLYGKYSADSASFQQAIVDCIAQAPTKDTAALASLLSLQFQTFTAVPIVGDQPQVVPFPVAKRKRIATQKVSTKAA
jgi:transposase